MTGKRYVGKSINISHRFKAHLKDSRSYIDRALKKYGQDAFAFDTLELCSEDVLSRREIHWIATFDCVVPNGYNHTYGGDGGGRPSLETRKKLSLARKGKLKSDEHRKKISEAHIGLKKNITLPPEHRRKIGESVKLSYEHGRRTSQKGKRMSEETKRKISEAQKGRYFSPEHRRKISEGQKERYARQKLSKS